MVTLADLKAAGLGELVFHKTKTEGSDACIASTGTGASEIFFITGKNFDLAKANDPKGVYVYKHQKYAGWHVLSTKAPAEGVFTL